MRAQLKVEVYGPSPSSSQADPGTMPEEDVNLLQPERAQLVESPSSSDAATGAASKHLGCSSSGATDVRNINIG